MMVLRRSRFGNGRLLRRLVAPLMVIAMMAAVFPASAAEPYPDCPGKTTRPSGRWRLTPVDDFPTDNPEALALGAPLTTFASDPRNPRLIFIADWSTIMRSEDGGCTWEKAFSLNDLNPSAPTVGCRPDVNAVAFLAGGCLRITSIDIAPTESGPPRVLVQINRFFANVALYIPTAHTTLIVKSDDGGQSFSLVGPSGADNALATLGTGDLVVSPSDPNIVYATRSDAAYQNLFVSKDAGGTWTRMNAPQGHFVGILAIDPGDPQHLWSTAARVDSEKRAISWDAYRSTDGGKTWSRVVSPVQTLSHIVIGRIGNHSRVFMADHANNRLMFSDDGGTSWRDLSTANTDIEPKEGTVVVGRNADELFVIGAVDVMRYRIARGMTTAIKTTMFGDGMAPGDDQTHGSYSKTAGLRVLLHCNTERDNCWIARYPV